MLTAKFRTSDGLEIVGTLREAFENGLSNAQSSDSIACGFGDSGNARFIGEAQQAEWERWSDEERALWLTGRLWNCSDLLPNRVVEMLRDMGIKNVSTYAQTSRRIRSELRTEV